MSIRCTAKAIIINHGKVLLNKCCDRHNGQYFSLPGGGQKMYESIYDAVIRECLEETGYVVSPVRFAALYEEIYDDKSFRENHPDYAHKIYHIFTCGLQSENKNVPTEIDDMQIESEWIDIGQIDHIFLLPEVVGDNLLKIIHSDVPVYLGSNHIQYGHG